MGIDKAARVWYNKNNKVKNRPCRIRQVKRQGSFLEMLFDKNDRKEWILYEKIRHIGSDDIQNF